MTVTELIEKLKMLEGQESQVYVRVPRVAQRLPLDDVMEDGAFEVTLIG